MKELIDAIILMERRLRHALATLELTNVDGTDTIVDQFGVDPKFLDYFKNMVYNSSFEVFDETTTIPTYWTAGVSDPNSNFNGSYSMKLTASQSSEQASTAYINPAFFDRGRARLTFHSKAGQVKVEVYDNTNARYFTLTDNEGNQGTSITFDEQSNWQDSRSSVSFDTDESPGSCVSLKVKFTNVHATDPCYIDAVQLHPDFTGKWSQLYKDGPNSTLYALNQIVVSTTSPSDTSKLWYDIS